jgi:NitT/TauT family transport system permease protein
MRGWLHRTAFALILVGIWAAAASVARSPLFPSPHDVVASLREAGHGVLARAVMTTGARLFVGYVLALAMGIPLGVVLAKSRLVKQTAGPLIVGLSSIPSICWLPLALLWFGLSETAIQVVVVLGALLPIAVATEGAVRVVPPQVERAARTMGARGLRLLVSVTIPAAFPGVVNGAKLGWTFALRSLMAGELLFVSGGLGQLLETGRDLGDTGLVVGIMVVILVLGRLVDALVFARLDRLVVRRWGAAA